MKNFLKLLIQLILNNISEPEKETEIIEETKLLFPALKINRNCYKQKIASIMGKSGCAFLSCVYIAESIRNENIDAIQAFDYCLKQNYLSEEGYVNSWQNILEYLTGKKVNVNKVYDLTYFPKENEYLIGCYTLTATHFVVLDNNYSVIYDPLEKSNHVMKGELNSLRVVQIED